MNLACLYRGIYLRVTSALARLSARPESGGRRLFPAGGSVLSLWPGLRCPNFNTLLALHATNVEESTEILTIFPWYNYLLAVFIFALGSLRFAVRIVEPSRWGKMDTLGLLFSIGISFSSRCKTLPGAVYSR